MVYGNAQFVRFKASGVFQVFDLALLVSGQKLITCITGGEVRVREQWERTRYAISA